ncbi:unnamed protein product [Cuscuta epithymum]|uniref:Uncharacterized protein n=1 Tax=Cuscuta epithymum TaxID=186058 RepID=A0AAV0GCK3_9ASTE|nr:unnamed protein product [Cuscuta epithymum]
MVKGGHPGTPFATLFNGVELPLSAHFLPSPKNVERWLHMPFVCIGTRDDNTPFVCSD